MCRRLSTVEPGDYIYTTLARDILLIVAGGSRVDLGPKDPKWPVCPSPPPQWLIGVSFLQLQMFFNRYEYFHRALALPDSLFLPFLRFKISKFSSGSQNLSEIGY